MERTFCLHSPTEVMEHVRNPECVSAKRAWLPLEFWTQGSDHRFV